MALILWLYQNVFGNLVASLLWAVPAWFWKIRPHFRRQRQHHSLLVAQLAALRGAQDALHAKIDQGKDDPT